IQHSSHNSLSLLRIISLSASESTGFDGMCVTLLLNRICEYSHKMFANRITLFADIVKKKMALSVPCPFRLSAALRWLCPAPPASPKEQLLFRLCLHQEGSSY
ncbi:MAG: hypothetical protein K2P59_09890, partial [Acetatifactor sp.]|nr:hypothetical protein [Acetatifactor sp.]